MWYQQEQQIKTHRRQEGGRVPTSGTTWAPRRPGRGVRGCGAVLRTLSPPGTARHAPPRRGVRPGARSNRLPSLRAAGPRAGPGPLRAGAPADEGKANFRTTSSKQTRGAGGGEGGRSRSPVRGPREERTKETSRPHPFKRRSSGGSWCPGLAGWGQPARPRPGARAPRPDGARVQRGSALRPRARAPAPLTPRGHGEGPRPGRRGFPGLGVPGLAHGLSLLLSSNGPSGSFGTNAQAHSRAPRNLISRGPTPASRSAAPPPPARRTCADRGCGGGGGGPAARAA